MDNLKTYTQVELGGKEYLLKFDYNAISDLEERFNKGIVGILQEEQIGFRLVRIFYWAGLKWKIPGLTLDRVGTMLGKELSEGNKGITELMEPVMQALTKSKLLGIKTDDADNETEENENPNE